MTLPLLLALPPLLTGFLAAGFGAIVGSFLNVVIYRLHTGRSLSGRSHCMSCGGQLRWYHLVPVVSYLVLRGRCGHCGARFTSRYIGVEVLTALLFATVALTTPIFALPILLIIVSLLILLVVYDLRHMIIPDELTVLTGIAVVALLAVQLLLGLTTWTQIGTAALAAVISASFFFLLWYISGGRWIGFGDVKLAVPLGLLVGGAGAFSMVVLSFWVGAVVSLTLLGLAKVTHRFRGQYGLPSGAGALTMKSAVPFAPFLVIAALLVYFGHVDVLQFFTYEW